MDGRGSVVVLDLHFRYAADFLESCSKAEPAKNSLAYDF